MSADTLDEFWDYEHQVDLEAFSSTTFYNILLKQSLSVTTRLGQLTAEVCHFNVLLADCVFFMEAVGSHCWNHRYKAILSYFYFGC